MGRATLLVAALSLALAGCSDSGEDGGPPTVTAHPSATPDGSATGSSSPSASASADASDPAPAGKPRVAKVLADGLEVPWGIDFLPDGTALVTERDSGRVLAIDERGTVTPVGGLPQVSAEGESGLLGVAVSPDFRRDRSVYFYLTTAEDNRVVRTRFAGGGLGPTEVVLDGIPNGFIHDGGRLEFGPDGFLYVSTGETGQPELAQDRGSLGGKILRITPDGDPAPGNPDPSSPVWSWGHRNVQGLAFDDSGNLWASEFGDSTYDELNLIEEGANYGWPMVEGRGGGRDLTNPQVVWDTAEASPSGLAHLDGNLWLAALRGERLWRVDIHDGRASEPTDFFVGEYGRLRTVVVAPDGALWVTTSNTDGRAEPGPRDDQILVVQPD